MVISANTSESHPNPVTRVLSRLNGIQHRPDETATFLRNALWAEKLLQYAEQHQYPDGRKMEIACGTGLAHAGLEDFLRLDSNLLRKIILAYPKEYLDKLTRVNGGAEQVSGIKLIGFNKKGESYEPFEKEFFVDQALQSGLEQKIGITT